MNRNKNTRLRNLVPLPILAFQILIAGQIASCNTVADENIKADIRSKAKDNLHFMGISYAVNKGVVTLFGYFPSEKSKSLALEKIKRISVIREVKDSTKIYPILPPLNLPLKDQVDSVLTKYPNVSANVSINEVMLKGKLPSKQQKELFAAIQGVITKTYIETHVED